MVAGLAAEKIASDRRPYEELVNEQILKPLGMTSAVWITPNLDDWTGMAMPHIYTLDGKFVRMDTEVIKYVYRLLAS